MLNKLTRPRSENKPVASSRSKWTTPEPTGKLTEAMQIRLKAVRRGLKAMKYGLKTVRKPLNDVKSRLKDLKLGLKTV